ncbi:MAG TPA: hypothetical protein VG248_17570 [Caulobacteraceae bacterium]|jgi:hypothetical protein|nr:hypothetical protein [Caulobacteraceae bacterium]
MIARRLLATAMIVAALLACGGAIVVSLAFAVFALLQPLVGDAGAAAVVAGGAALVLGACALVANLILAPRRRAAPPAPAASPTLARVMELVADRPVATIAGGLVAAVLAARDPEYVGAALRAFLAGRPPRR